MRRCFTLWLHEWCGLGAAGSWIEAGLKQICRWFVVSWPVLLRSTSVEESPSFPLRIRTYMPCRGAESDDSISMVGSLQIIKYSMEGTFVQYIAIRRKIRLIESNAKCRYLKNWHVKGICGRCFIFLRLPPLLWPHTTPLSHCIRVYSIQRRGKGGGRAYQREGHRWATVH
jgi:hypothetical protein